MKGVFLFYLQIFSETFLIIMRTERVMIKNVYWQCLVEMQEDSQIHNKLFYWIRYATIDDIRIISSTNFNPHFNINMYVTLLSSTCFGP